MNKKIILMTSIVTIAVMAIVSCKKSVESTTELTYENVKGKIIELEKEIKKKRGQLAGSNSWISNPSIPIPAISQFMYCGSTTSPLGANYIRFKYKVNYIPNAIYFSNNFAIEFKIFYKGMDQSDGWKFKYPLTIGNGKPIMGAFPKCISLDVPVNILQIPDLMTASLIPNSAPTSNYEVNAYNGYIANSALTPTIAVSKAWLLDPLTGANPCP